MQPPVENLAEDIGATWGAGAAWMAQPEVDGDIPAGTEEKVHAREAAIAAYGTDASAQFTVCGG
jgi:hypothetical protein